MTGPVNAPNDVEIKAALRKAGLTQIGKSVLNKCKFVNRRERDDVRNSTLAHSFVLVC